MLKTNIKPKRILFAHSAGSQGGPGEGSFDLVSAIETELSHEYEIRYPIIDNPNAPTYETWNKLFNSVFKKNTEPLILVGHSLGGSMLLKYLSEEKADVSIAGLFLISIPLWGEEGWEVEEFVLPEKFEAKLRHISNVYLYHSKYDEIVPFEHLNFYRNAFPYATVRELSGKDHAFTGGLPDLVLDIKNI
jgi:predicted alpha/beta hydrolase family esterase